MRGKSLPDDAGILARISSLFFFFHFLTKTKDETLRMKMKMKKKPSENKKAERKKNGIRRRKCFLGKKKYGKCLSRWTSGWLKSPHKFGQSAFEDKWENAIKTKWPFCMNNDHACVEILFVCLSCVCRQLNCATYQLCIAKPAIIVGINTAPCGNQSLVRTSTCGSSLLLE